MWDAIGESVLDLLDHTAYRRYGRFPARLTVRTAKSAGAWDELTELVARGGICLRTRRDVLPGATERYRIHLPAPLAPVDVEGDVIARATLPGYASVLAGGGEGFAFELASFGGVGAPATPGAGRRKKTASRCPTR